MKKWYIPGVVGVIVFYVIISLLSDFYFDFRWFDMYGGADIFWRLFSTKFIVHTVFTIIFIIFFSLNFLLIRLLGGKGRIFTVAIINKIHIPLLGTPKRAFFIILATAVVLVGFIMGGAASAYWRNFLLYLYALPFHGFPVDPIFGKEIGFYVFSLPVYNFLYGWLFSVLLILLVFSVLFHIINRGIFLSQGKLEFSLFARAHISTLLAAIVFLYGLGYRLSSYELLYSSMGKFFGAGYTSVYANLTSYTVAMVLSFLAAALFLFNIFKRSFKLPIIVLSALLPVYFILGVLFPTLLQKIVVVPNELDKERPFISHNIQFTRIGYNIHRLKEVEFNNKDTLTYADIEKNRTVIENIRLWDWEPLKDTYKQMQEFKSYYSFHDVDVDRYIIGGNKFAVNLSARELSIDKLPSNSQSWQNRHIIYTHGYGMVMSRVDRITPEGLPELIIRDNPPVSSIPITIDRPEIYFGEHKNDYVITNTTIRPGEFDYPSGNENKYTTYRGTGGIQIGSFWQKLLCALYFGDKNIIFSGNITPESRILFRRNIVEMVTTFTPFLDFDDDPYLVVSEGKLYWIIDAYTSTDQFPYSTPIVVNDKKINYIRNSVKIVIDAYNGTMTYYISDESDPIIQVYARIFPNVFHNLRQMPAGLQAHIRYPEDMFTIQSNMLLKYHMTDPTTFYNNSELWEIPSQTIEGQKKQIESYYLVTKLPDETMEEFILILPFSSYGQPNMVSFLTAKCDPQNYGELKLYKLPKGKLNYGPSQVEARINSNPEISASLSLWNQRGSRVLKGNMLAIPIAESILYIEPVYLKAESSAMPELRRVIIAFGEKIIMEKDLESCLDRMFGRGRITQSSIDSSLSKEAQLKELASKAYNSYLRGNQFIKQGDWGKYGEEMKQLQEILQMMKGL